MSEVLLRVVIPFEGKLRRAFPVDTWSTFEPSLRTPGCEERDKAITGHLLDTAAGLFADDNRRRPYISWWTRPRDDPSRGAVVVLAHRAAGSFGRRPRSRTRPQDLLIVILSELRNRKRDVLSDDPTGKYGWSTTLSVGLAEEAEAYRAEFLRGDKGSVYFFGRRAPGFLYLQGDLPRREKDRHRALFAACSGKTASARDVRDPQITEVFESSGVELYRPWSALAERYNLTTWSDKNPPSQQHIEDDHFTIYLLNLWTRLRAQQLYDLLAQAASTGLPDGHRQRRYREDLATLLDEWLAFRTQFWSSEVSRNTACRALHTALRRSFGLEPLIEEIEYEMNVLKGRADSESEAEERRNERLLNLLAVMYLPLASIGGFLGMNVFANPSDITPSIVALVVGVSILPAGLVATAWVLRRWP